MSPSPESRSPEGPSLESTAYRASLDVIGGTDPQVADMIRGELGNQRSQLKLIASENYASPAVLLAMGNWLSDKYAEGTPGHRFYAGCEWVDEVESLAADRARQLFGADHAYVQPHSGIDANLVAFWSILSARVEAPALADHGVKNVAALDEDDWEDLRHRLNDQRMLGMSLDAGGHLTHGFRPNISGKLFHQRSYGVDPQTGQIDYDDVARMAREFRPLIIVAGYSAYPRLIDFARMREIADEVDATLMVDMAHFAGLVAGKVFTGDHDPVAHAPVVTTTTHKSLRGPRGGMVLCTEEFAPFVDRGCPLVLGGPMPHVMAAKAVAFAEALTEEFRTYAGRIVDNAKALAEALAKRDVTVVSGGTDNHLVLIDTATSFDLTGRQAEQALLDAGVVTNRNSIPADPNGAWYTSGVRIGTPAVTTLGMGTAEMDEVADIIATALSATTPSSESQARYDLPASTAEGCRSRAADLLARHPLYPELDLG
ncbi:glycine hydroxymethyltransferase [Euzebya sp.]|uniref:glycine hydroxymethyltransferase n=1 Tax=Euzebya sp. TaxID=1971409 RepID=UPI003514FA87